MLRDEAGRPFAFRVVRALRDEGRLLLLAEREGEGTLHVLARDGDEIVLVRDRELLRRVATGLDVLQRASAGELVELRLEGTPRVLGIYAALEPDGPHLAADLLDPSLVVALCKQGEGYAVVTDAAVLLAAYSRLRALADAALAPDLGRAAVGLAGELVELTDASGATLQLRAVGRLFCDGHDVLFAAPLTAPERALAFVVEGERLTPADAALSARLSAQLTRLCGR